ncbi:hypothetical protein O3M35_010340 [Rhynocoris fuscipes]|uniref:Uncharacterized protein n=1 Tax=Rhynocoris fuscipes TaxID=488301 RepID=A0AAW1D5M0_9HEMI
MLIYQADQVKTNEELNLFNNLNLQKAKQFRVDIVDYINKAQLLLKDVDEMVMNQIVNITESDKLNEENYYFYIEQVKNFENNITNITLQFQENNSSDGIYAIKNRGMALKNEMNLLKSNLDESTVKGLKYLNHYYGNETIMSRYENLTNSANELIDNIIEKEQSVREINCINAIKMKNFELAELHLNEIIDDKRIISIVNKTYSGISNNYYLIIKFSEHISNLTRSFFIFNELNNELRQNCDITINKLYTLIKSLTKTLVNQKTFDIDVSTKALDMIDLLRKDLNTFGIMHLADILEEDDVKFSEINALDKIVSLDLKLAVDMFYESYKFSNNNGNTTINKFIEIFNVLMKEYLNDGKKLFNYVIVVKQFFIKIDQKQHINKCLEIIKTSSNASSLVKAILFANKVCIYSEQNKVLGAQKTQGYKVKISKIKMFHNKDYWQLNDTDANTFEIKNVHFTDYLINLVNISGHEVSMQHKDITRNNVWKLEPIDNSYVYIKNLNNNEYLNAKSVTITTGEFEKSSKYHWRIKDCSVCQHKSFHCDNGKCIKFEYWCDGDRNDCGDGSDERKCCKRSGDHAFECEYSSTCIPRSWVCDVGLDCPSGTDEHNCKETD